MTANFAGHQTEMSGQLQVPYALTLKKGNTVLLWKPLDPSGRGEEENTVAAGRQIPLIQPLTSHRKLTEVSLRQQ